MQNAAYVIRISDWCSDVCSSDLHSAFACRPRVEPPRQQPNEPPPCRWQRRRQGNPEEEVTPAVTPETPAFRRLLPTADRKNVVKGKGVSVGFTIGGRSISKKQHNTSRRLVESRRDTTQKI